MSEQPTPRERVVAHVRAPGGEWVVVPWSQVRAECTRLRGLGILQGPEASADRALRRLARRLRPELFPD